jgi:hypothetical protein
LELSIVDVWYHIQHYPSIVTDFTVVKSRTSGRLQRGIQYFVPTLMPEEIDRK